VPEVRAGVPPLKLIREPFTHYSHTFTNQDTYLRIVDREYYARFVLRSAFTAPMYMSIFVLAIGQRFELPPILSSLANLIRILRTFGFNVSVVYINRDTVDIYIWSSRPLASARHDISYAFRRHMPSNVTVNAAYYIVGEDIMIWDDFNWDSGKVWANDPTRVYP
jgi:hypothetical protein